jgi:hypothetical protein
MSSWVETILNRLGKLPGIGQAAYLGYGTAAANPQLKINNDPSTSFINSILDWMRAGRDQGGYLSNIDFRQGSVAGNTLPASPDAASLVADMPNVGVYGGQASEIPSMVKNSPNAIGVPSVGNTQSILDASQKAAGAAGNWINNYAKTLPPPVAQKPPVDPLSDIYDLYKQMLNNMGGGVATQSPEALRSLAEKQIALQFDPQIAALQQEMKERKSRYAANKQEMLDLWNSLSDSYMGDGNLSSGSYDQLISEQEGNTGDIEALLTENYGDSLGYMDDQFSKLGIGDASEYTEPLLTNDYNDIMSRLGESDGSFNEFLSANDAAFGDYSGAMANSARMHGAEGVQDLMDELNYYLDSANSNMTSLRSQRGTSLELLVQQMMQQQAQAQALAQQQSFDNLMKAAQFRMDLQGLSNNMNKQPETPTYSSGLLGATQQFAGNPNAAQLSGILQELLARQEFVENQFLGADGTVVDMNPQKAANMALQEAQKRGLNQADTIQLMNAMYALFGKLGS